MVPNTSLITVSSKEGRKGEKDFKMLKLRCQYLTGKLIASSNFFTTLKLGQAERLNTFLYNFY